MSGTLEIVPTRPKKHKGEGGIADATRQHTGLTDILEWVGKASGIDDDVRASFSEGDAAKMLSIARYWIGSGGNTLPRLESWQVMHPLPYHEHRFSFRLLRYHQDTCPCSNLMSIPIHDR